MRWMARLRIGLGFALATALGAGAWPSAAEARPQDAGGPRIVYMAQAAQRPVEIGLSPRKVTLMRFEAGDVSMLVVGDRALVSFEVHGQDVLLKAAAASGRTNMFVWAAGQYTQWTLIVREGTESRVIIVRPGDPPEQAAAPAQAERPPARAQQTFARTPAPRTAAPAAQPAQQQPAQQAPARQPDAAAEPHQALLERFLRTLTPAQSRLFVEYTANPTFARLQALLQALRPDQRDLLARLLATRDDPGAAARPAQQQPGQQAPAQPAEPRVTAAVAQQEIPGGVTFETTVRRTGNALLVSYVMANEGQTLLLADINRLRVFNEAGEEIGFTVSRASSGQFLGRMQPGDVETGTIVVSGVHRAITVQWTFVEVGTGATRTLRVQVATP
jgi:hypothetical protein